MYDVIIVGGGPAGLSAAEILGRCRRRVLVCDAGQPRNSHARAVHAFLTRDGAPPAELLALARAELRRYDTVEYHHTIVTGAARVDNQFEVTVQSGERFRSRKLLLATGVVDEIPPIEGIDEFHGRSVFHCPYCDAWEWRDQPLAVYGRNSSACRFAVDLTLWSKDMAFVSDGAEVSVDDRALLEAWHIGIFTQKIDRLEGRDGHLERIRFADGQALARRAMFFSSGQYKRQALADRLGCDFTDKGCISVDDYGAANVPGLYAAGDVTKLSQMVVIAASEGLQAGIVINKALLKEDQTSEGIFDF